MHTHTHTLTRRHTFTIVRFLILHFPLTYSFCLCFSFTIRWIVCFVFMWIFSFNFSFEFNNKASHVPLPCKCSVIYKVIVSGSFELIHTQPQTHKHTYRCETNIYTTTPRYTHAYIAFVFAKWPYFKKWRQNNRCFNNWVCWVVEVKAKAPFQVF